MKSSNINKNTIHFKSKKEELKNLNKIHNSKKDYLRFYKEHDNSHKVLQYPSRRKKGVKKFNKVKEYFNKNKYTKVILCVILFIGLLFIADKILLNNNDSSKSQNTFTSENINVAKSKASTYSSIIEQTVKKYAGINYKVTTEDMHKNGNTVYATGYFQHPSEGEIYFDIILENNNPSSLVINGEEYID
ncbi:MULTISPECIES: hypothetical protein [unclassified Romboutsia]|uniref:hypothetical protein n=1 Tax=unclassified Romboutsia TaxID=2626894 RepID=UPI000821E3C3|nr:MULTISPECIES: hypothetical protein [unclassified Romboutsia]SCH51267.1 Uncharacterised protein [uncultured Clostridium sp.]